MRAFIAIDLPPDTQRVLADLLQELSGIRCGVKWCDPRQIHITLKFFGELPEALLKPVISVVTSATGAIGPVQVRIRGVGSFGPGDRIRVVWAGVEDPTGNLANLSRVVEDAVEPLGFPREGRPFRPHLTVGRLREPTRDRRLTEALQGKSRFEGGGFVADRLVLFSSTLTPGGPIYRAVHSWPLEAER